MPRPSLSDLQARVLYCPKSGAFHWRADCGPESFKSVRAWNVWRRKFAGKAIGKTNRGYVVVAMTTAAGACEVAGHIAAWVLANGEWPAQEVDHKNRNRADNRLVNLRLATHQQNGQNKGVQRNSKCGRKGVHQHTQNGNWVAQITVNGRRKHLGSFPSVDEASNAYMTASMAIHGAFSAFAQGEIE